MTDIVNDVCSRSADVVVLDDDDDFLAFAELLLVRHGHRCRVFADADDAIASLKAHPADVLLLDYRLEGVTGMELVGPLRDAAPMLEILFVTAHSSPDVAAEALRSGALDFLSKPLDEGRLVASIGKALEHAELVSRVQQLELGEDDTTFEGIVGRSSEIQTVFRIIENVAPTDVSVMIRGESGTGKELVARAVHNRSRRREGPFVALNMAALPASLVESTLFGHEKGAYTGATSRSVGACEEAAGGTLFLDEICEMPIELQAKVLRFLQEGVFRRLGGSSDVHSDARIISATNRDPIQEIRKGTFREDLYYRLNVVPVPLPPLRDRVIDIERISEVALDSLSRRHGKRFVGIEPAALQLMNRHDWPGNVRELLHVLERVVVLNEGPNVTAAMLPAEVCGTSRSQALDDMGDPSPIDFGGSAPSEIVPLDTLERRAIEHALEVCQGSVVEAARALRVSQATIYRKLKTYGLERNRFTPRG